MKNNRKNIFVVILLTLSIINIYLRLFFGWDQDESLIIVLAERMANGKVMFRDLWDLAQTSGLFPAIFVKIYLDITNSYDGIGLFLRAVSAAVQVLVSIFCYFMLKKHYDKYASFCAAVIVANMLPRATQQLEYGATSVWAMLVCSLILLDMQKKDKNSLIGIAIAALSYSVAVFVYPTMIITVPFMIYVIGFRLPKPRLKAFICFWIICALSAGVFFVYLFSNMSMVEFAKVLHELGKNGDHGTFFRAFTRYYYVLRTGGRLVATIVLAFCVSALIKKIFKIRVNAFYVYIFAMTTIVFILNVTGLRPSGPFGFLERYIGATILFWVLDDRNQDRDLLELLYFTGIVSYVGALMGSNLGFNENAMILELSVIALALFAYKDIMEKEGTSKLICECAFSVFLVGIVVSSGYFVRVDGTGPANYHQCTVKMTEGPLKGILITPEKYESMKVRCDAIRNNTQENELNLIVVNDPVYYFYVKGDFNSVMYTTTAEHNMQWVDYYTEFDRQLPDVIWVDTGRYSDLSLFEKTEFGSWCKMYYANEKTDSDDLFMKLVLKD